MRVMPLSFPGMLSHKCSIKYVVPARSVFKIFNIKNATTLKYRLLMTSQDH